MPKIACGLERKTSKVLTALLKYLQSAAMLDCVFDITILCEHVGASIPNPTGLYVSGGVFVYLY